MSENLYYQTIAKGATFFFDKLEELSLLESLNPFCKINTLQQIINLFSHKDEYLYDNFTFHLFKHHSVCRERQAHDDYFQIVKLIVQKTFEKKVSWSYQEDDRDFEDNNRNVIIQARIDGYILYYIGVFC